MNSRWLGAMWVAAAAVGVGLLVAAVTNVGSNSSRIFGLLVVVVAVPAVITLGYEGLRNRARSKGAHPKSFRSAPEHLRHSSPTFEAVPEDRQFGNDRGKLTDGDWEALRALCTTLGTAQVAWLKSTEFVTPWLDAHARSVIELEARVLEIIERPFQEAVSAALEALLEAASAFSEFYAGSTYPDPLLLGEDWRFFDVKTGGSSMWRAPARLRKPLSCGAGVLPTCMGCRLQLPRRTMTWSRRRRPQWPRGRRPAPEAGALIRTVLWRRIGQS